MGGARGGRLIGAALRCYPARWRRRHADEAAEVAALLIRDGAPAASVAWSYFLGAARERLFPRPGRPQSAVAAALLAATCVLGFSAALVAETVPARAAGTTKPGTTKPGTTQSHPASPKAGPVPSATRSPRHAAPCRTPAAGYPRLSVREAAHARSC
jgi:hypothetical protein